MDRDREYVLDIITSARLAQSYVQGIEENDFLSETRLQDSVIRRLEVIGEAAGRISTQFREQHPGIPWHDMIGMRNRMIHGYDDVDLEIVWNTVQEASDGCFRWNAGKTTDGPTTLARISKRRRAMNRLHISKADRDKLTRHQRHVGTPLKGGTNT